MLAQTLSPRNGFGRGQNGCPSANVVRDSFVFLVVCEEGGSVAAVSASFHRGHRATFVGSLWRDRTFVGGRIVLGVERDGGDGGCARVLLIRGDA
jgi:hypothetical protein